MRKGFLASVERLSRVFSIVAGCALVFLMALTVLDVILRAFRKPILGAYELVAFAGAVAIGFSLPRTSWLRGHIFVDFLIGAFPRKVRNGFHTATRLAGICLFFFAGTNLIRFSVDLKRHGEVSPTLQFPFYPIVFGVGVACIALCLVLLADLVKIAQGEYE